MLDREKSGKVWKTSFVNFYFLGITLTGALIEIWFLYLEMWKVDENTRKSTVNLFSATYCI